MCQTGCPQEHHITGNCRLPGPCIHEPDWKQIERDEDAEADCWNENLDALKRREGV